MKTYRSALMTFFASLLFLFLYTPLHADNTELVVKARGSKAYGMYSHFKVLVNGVNCGSKYASMDFEEYKFTVPFDKEEIRKVEIVFDNDVYTMGEDRNLCVASILIGNEIPMKACRKSVQYVCQNGEQHPYCGMMQWNGTLTFDVEALKIHEGNVTLTTQEEVNLFAEQHVQGSLTISGDDITDLSPLSMLASVGRALIIEHNPNLVTIRGLNSLMLAGFISIENNPKLQSIDGFDSLDHCGGMYIRDNGLLNTVKCFESPGI